MGRTYFISGSNTRRVCNTVLGGEANKLCSLLSENVFFLLKVVFALALFSQHNVVISTGQYFNHAERNGMFATKSIRFRYPGINWPIILTIEFLARRQYRKPLGVGTKVFLERALTKCTSDTRVGNQAMFHVPLSRCTSRNYELESEYSFPGYQGQQHNLIRWTSLLVKN